MKNKTRLGQDLASRMTGMLEGRYLTSLFLFENS